MTFPHKPNGGANPFPNLPKIVSDLRDVRTRSHQTRYGGAPLPELPSKTATIEIVDGLVSTLFPRHFGPPRVNRG